MKYKNCYVITDDDRYPIGTRMCSKCNVPLDKGKLKSEGESVVLWNCQKCNRYYKENGEITDIPAIGVDNPNISLWVPDE